MTVLKNKPMSTQNERYNERLTDAEKHRRSSDQKQDTETSLMFCTRCGAPLTQAVAICPQCGARLCPGCGE